MLKVEVIMININNLQLTKDAVNDLLLQTAPYLLQLVDQGSIEKGTREYLRGLSGVSKIKVVRNSKNIELHELWNKFYKQSEAELLCFLNNDVRVPSNFIQDTVKVFELEPTVGCVIHSTNHSRYKETTPLRYRILRDEFGQGWDFTVRRSAYTLIPDELKLFYGDDFIFNNLYLAGWKTAIVLSSPVIHFGEKSHKSYSECEVCMVEGKKWMRAHGFKKIRHRNRYTRTTPEFLEIKETLEGR